MNGLSKCVVLKKAKKDVFVLFLFFLLLGQNGVENLHEYVANGVLKIFNIWMANAESFCFKRAQTTQIHINFFDDTFDDFLLSLIFFSWGF